MKKIAVYIIGMVCGYKTTGQSIVCKEVSQKYNHSIVAGIYLLYGNNISSIECSDQLKLAAVLFERDSVIAKNVETVANVQSIRSALNKVQKKLDDLIAEIKTETFFQKQNKKIVDAEVKFFQQKYGIQKEDSLQLHQLLTAKYRFFNKAFTHLREDKTFEAELNQQLSYNWNVIRTAYNAEAAKYFDEQVQKLNIIKKIPADDYKKMYDRYFELVKITTSFSNKDRFDIAFRQTNTDTAYYRVLYSQHISDIAIPFSITERQLLLRYKPSVACMDSLNKIIAKKSRHIAAITLAFNGRYGRSDTLIRKASAPYDSLMYVQLLKDGAYVGSGIINAAIKYRTQLGLRYTQTDSLIESGMQLDKMKDSAWQLNALASYDTKDFENYWLSKIMEEEQLFFLLGKKYIKDATTNAVNDWTDLEKRGLTKDLKKEEVIAELTMYYVKVKASTTMYAFDEVKQSAYGKSAREAIPKALRTLQYARKNNITLSESKQ